MESVTHFLFLGSKITASSDCNHESKRRLTLGRKTMTKLDSILKSIDFASKGPYRPSCGFPRFDSLEIKARSSCEDLLEMEMATHSSILAWRIPLTEEPGRLQSMGLQGSDMI